MSRTGGPAVLLLFVALLGGYFGFSATHHTALAITCLVHALLMIHPIRALVLFCLGAAGTAVVGAVRLVLPDRAGSRRRDPQRPDGAGPSRPDLRPPDDPRFAWSGPRLPSAGAMSPPAEPPVRPIGRSDDAGPDHSGPFLDRRGRRLDRR